MGLFRECWHQLNPYWLATCRWAEGVRHRVGALPDKCLRANWPRQRANESERRTVGIVTVNYNTRDHIARLIYSIYRNLPSDRVVRVVVVDNGSTDGSIEFLTALRDAGLIDLIANRKQKYHGPGVNQGIRHLCELTRGASPDKIIDYVWVLDSDTVVVRPDVLDRAIDSVRGCRAGLAGEFELPIPSLPTGYAHICSLLLDPVLVWRRQVQPMWESGTPAEAMQFSCERLNIRRLDHPFMKDGYVIHLGSGTLKIIRETGINGNRYTRWAGSEDRQFQHFHGNLLAPKAYDLFLQKYNSAVHDDSAESLIAECFRCREENCREG